MAVQYAYEPFNNIQLDALGKHVFFGGLQVAGKAGGPDMAEMRRVAETMQVQVPAGATDAAMLAACRLWISGATGPALRLHAHSRAAAGQPYSNDDKIKDMFFVGTIKGASQNALEMRANLAAASRIAFEGRATHDKVNHLLSTWLVNCGSAP